jgi:acyl-CoA synthetase (AMP-forming)/AMP-acid ligase II
MSLTRHAASWRSYGRTPGATMPGGPRPGRRGEAAMRRAAKCIRGPQVMKGYLNNPQATARAIDPDGWLHTGDVARVEEDGSLRIVDRLKEMIKYKGYQIAPAELEAVLLTHPAIADAAVIPVPDEEAGEVPKAFVVPSGPITAEEVTRFVAGRVAPYKKLRAVEIVEEIPKSPSGKVLRRVLIERERTAAMPGEDR